MAAGARPRLVAGSTDASAGLTWSVTPPRPWPESRDRSNRIDPERRLVDVRLEHVLDDASIATLHDLPALGTRAWAKLSAIKSARPGGSDGCLILKLPGQERETILRYNAMSDDLRHEFDTDA